MAHQDHSHIVFIDEAGFMLAPLRRHTWAPRGKTPVIKVMSPHERISAIGAMTIQRHPVQFGFQFHLLADNANFNGRSVAGFVKTLGQRLRGPITLIWDECRIHWAWPVKELLHENPNIDVEPLPPYAPELNPVDYVWSYVKWSRLANYCPLNLVELRKTLIAELTMVANQPALLRLLFSGTGLTPNEADPA
jgi:putative transposase